MRPSGGAVLADEVLLVRELAAVVHQEAAHAGELVVLARADLHGELLVGEVRAGKLEGLGGFRLVLVHLPGVLVVPASLELLQAFFALVLLVLARSVVVSCHVPSPAPVFPSSPLWPVVRGCCVSCSSRSPQRGEADCAP